LQAFGATLHFELDLLAFLERLEAAHLDRGVMREQVFTALGRGNEAEAFGVVEPLYGTGCHVHLLPVINAATIPGATKPGTTIKEVI
jgi:ATP:corrinoid adenosyltransferase